jgi:hypothetical protein
VAAQIRRQLHADVEMVHGSYGQFQVLVDGDTVIDGGALAVLGVLPSARKILEVVQRRISDTQPAV